MVNGFQTLNIVLKGSILDTIRILLQSDSKAIDHSGVLDTNLVEAN